jgi:hypothetical protein
LKKALRSDPNPGHKIIRKDFKNPKGDEFLLRPPKIGVNEFFQNINQGGLQRLFESQFKTINTILLNNSISLLIF